MSEPAKYRCGLLEVEAVRFNGSSSQAFEIEQWMNGGPPPTNGIHTCDITSIQIEKPEATLIVQAGDWIVKDPEGEFFPAGNQVFEKMYTEMVRKATA